MKKGDNGVILFYKDEINLKLILLERLHIENFNMDYILHGSNYKNVIIN